MGHKPLYRQIADRIREQITCGELAGKAHIQTQRIAVGQSRQVHSWFSLDHFYSRASVPDKTIHLRDHFHLQDTICIKFVLFTR